MISLARQIRRASNVYAKVQNHIHIAADMPRLANDRQIKTPCKSLARGFKRGRCAALSEEEKPNKNPQPEARKRKTSPGSLANHCGGYYAKWTEQ